MEITAFVNWNKLVSTFSNLLPDYHRSLFKVNAVQQAARFHVVFRMALKQLTLELELENRSSLMHARQFHLVLMHIFAVVLRMEFRTRILAVTGHGQRGKRTQRNTIANFQRFQIAILDAGHDHLCNAAVSQEPESPLLSGM